MYLFLSILLSVILGYLLFAMGPIVGGIAAFGIIAGSLFRGIYLLNDIRKRLACDSPVEKEVQEQQVTEVVPEHLKSPGAYKKYLVGKEDRGF
ncbi:hypothetical protein LC048_20385 [Mesobacillus subterraneus]|uniref:hypothetical protein n=1 Tax=Mesobacillus subterraneus TaxID=285983 RepID=UPI001CFF51D8|nr:hypothetical protein [Mesobacillus subterraneus]WLR54737.1 hypothetical protein LC048_20385 [Mesobacillus subterraneus]